MKKKGEGLGALWKPIGGFFARLYRDRVTVYAAQASFFTVLSTVPLISLTIAVISLFLPTDVGTLLERFSLPEWADVIVGSLLTDLQDAPKVSLLSISAVTTLWSASKGSAAVRAGIKTVYDCGPGDNYFLHRLKSLGYTMVFIGLLVGTVALLLFGDFLLSLLDLPLLTRIVRTLRAPIFVLALAAVFTVMYAMGEGSRVRHKEQVLRHLPGAFFAAMGWLLFSWLYALYIRYFPDASYVYGSLAAICLIMLWLYFCMVILLLGAEVNKLLSPQLGQQNDEKNGKSA